MIISSSLNLASGVIRMAGGVLSIAILSRSWEAPVFGAWAFVSAISGAALAFDLGLTSYAGSLSLARLERNEHGWREEASALVAITIAVAIIVSSIFYYSSDYLADFLHGEVGQVAISEAIKGSVFGLVGGRLIVNVGSMMLASQNKYNLSMIVNLIVTLSLLPVNSATVLTHASFAQNLNWQSTLLLILAIAALLWMISDGNHDKTITLGDWPTIGSKIRLTIKKSLSIFPASLSSSCFSSLDKLIVGGFLGGQSLAYYTIAALLASQINAVIALLTQPIVHLVPRANMDASLNSTLLKYGRFNLLAGPIVGIMLILATPFLRNIFLRDESISFDPILAEQAIATMCFIYGIYSVNCYGYYWFMAKQKYKACSIVVLVSSVTVLIGMLAVKGVFGLPGVVMCNSVYIGTCSLTLFALRGKYRQIKSSVFLSVLLLMIGLILLCFKYI